MTAPATQHVADPLLPFRQSSLAKEVVCKLCISENKHAVQRGCSASGLGPGQTQTVDVKGTATSPRKGECTCLHALKKLTHDC